MPVGARRKKATGLRRPVWVERLASTLCRVLAAEDSPPEAVVATAEALIDERTPAVLAELHFDSAVDSGPVPRVADRLGSRVLAFRASDTALVLGVEDIDGATCVKGVVVAPKNYRVRLRVLGGAAVEVSQPGDRKFRHQLSTERPVRVELAGEDTVAEVTTDWVLL